MPQPLPSIDALYERLLQFVNFEKGQSVDFRFDRLLGLLDRLGHPERALPCLHVAGSKGKGSVSIMLSRILEASGRRTGLYTSPHLLSFTERITRAGEPLGEGYLLDAWASIAPLVDGVADSDWPGASPPTFFEMATLLGMLAFARAGLQATVYEVGMGGRLDSTNVVQPEASVITPIELEHTEFLGDTIAQIAYEKAGIIKAGIPAFTSAQAPEALEVFRRVAAERGSPLTILDEACEISEVAVDRSGTRARVHFFGAAKGEAPLELSCPMPGAVQARNMALAALVARSSSFRCSNEAVVAGLEGARLRARFEILPTEPNIVLDGAHTPTSVAFALESFASIFPQGGQLIFACAYDKHHLEMATILRKGFSRVIVTRPGTFKKSEPALVAQSFESAGFEVELIEDSGLALRAARSRSEASGTPLLVVGSFYLAAEAAAAFAP